MNLIVNIIIILVKYFFPQKARGNILTKIISDLDLDPLAVAYESMGIMKYQNAYRSGEQYLLSKILPRLFSKLSQDQLVFFDIGANIGQYTLELHKTFPSALIFSLEPNPKTFIDLIESVSNIPTIKPFEIGIDIVKRREKLVTYRYALNSALATIYEKVISDIHLGTDTISYEIQLERLDAFAEVNAIRHIHFLKIDTEGNELNVLKSVDSLLRQDAVDVIQFEFNEMNVISRVFFKDFYDLLHERYELYRLDTERLLPIKIYNARLEIFKFQNILAVRRGLSGPLV